MQNLNIKFVFNAINDWALNLGLKFYQLNSILSIFHLRENSSDIDGLPLYSLAVKKWDTNSMFCPSSKYSSISLMTVIIRVRK